MWDCNWVDCRSYSRHGFFGPPEQLWDWKVYKIIKSRHIHLLVCCISKTSWWSRISVWHCSGRRLALLYYCFCSPFLGWCNAAITLAMSQHGDRSLHDGLVSERKNNQTQVSKGIYQHVASSIRTYWSQSPSGCWDSKVRFSIARISSSSLRNSFACLTPAIEWCCSTISFKSTRAWIR